MASLINSNMCFVLMQWNSFTIISNYMLIYNDFTNSNDRMKDKIAVAHQWSASNIGKSTTQTKNASFPNVR